MLLSLTLSEAGVLQNDSAVSAQTERDAQSYRRKIYPDKREEEEKEEKGGVRWGKTEGRRKRNKETGNWNQRRGEGIRGRIGV